MFVRWNKRKRSDRWKKPKADALYAVLVESIRIDGKPRQKTIKYLGYIPTDRINARAFVFSFWRAAERGLSELDLSPEDRDKITVTLRKVVPLLTDDVVVKANNEAMEKLKEIMSKTGSAYKRGPL